MKKRNPGGGDQTRQAAARARRVRRKAKLAALVQSKLRPLLLKLGQLEAENKLLRAKNPPSPGDAA